MGSFGSPSWRKVAWWTLVLLLQPVGTPRALSTSSKCSKAKSQLREIEAALYVYDAAYGRFPSEAEGLGALQTSGTLTTIDLSDPWGNDLYYRVQGARPWPKAECCVCNPVDT